MAPFCEEHTDMVKTLSRIEQIGKDTRDHIDRLDKRINGAFERLQTHVDEGERQGGYRDRLTKLEMLVTKATQEKLNSVKAAQWRVGLIVGAPATILAILKIVELLK